MADRPINYCPTETAGYKPNKCVESMFKKATVGIAVAIGVILLIALMLLIQAAQNYFSCVPPACYHF